MAAAFVGRVAFFAISMVLLSSFATATDFVVGDNDGWKLDYNYTKWAQDKVFHVGDVLVFKYNNDSHNVLKVNATSFKDCVTSDPLETFRSGHDWISLQSPGKKWYICGIAGHCADHQMKLVINVLADGPAPAPTSSSHSLVSSLAVMVAAAMIAVAAIFA
ncbi:blue copper protein 1a [Arachis duranensis]|uniref:Blue copper protein 1a n=1 Tax=Arachis duranensis TaxID=130453 RepID=A0A6P4DMW1_ARADU|nr:blue copper protein 1a [Arachis duranensis]